MSAARHAIERSFELAAAQCPDLTPLVYRRLFGMFPEAAGMFRSQGSDLVKGSMLALTIEAILDFAGERSGPFRMMACEVASHEAYGTPPDLFITFFAVIRDTLRDLLGEQWSPAMECGWSGLLAEIEALVRAA